MIRHYSACLILRGALVFNSLLPVYGQIPQTHHISRTLPQKQADASFVALWDKHWDKPTAHIHPFFVPSLEAMKNALDHGADVNARGEGGWTALMTFSIAIKPEVVAFLLSRGALVNLKTNTGDTALLAAARSGQSGSSDQSETNAVVNGKKTTLAMPENTEVVRLLLAHGADVNASDNSGTTALMHASGMGDIPAVQMLLDKGAKVNTKDNAGNTALMGASQTYFSALVKLLLAHGADVNAENDKGDTALSFARGQYATDVVHILQTAGAR